MLHHLAHEGMRHGITHAFACFGRKWIFDEFFFSNSRFVFRSSGVENSIRFSHLSEHISTPHPCLLAETGICTHKIIKNAALELVMYLDIAKMQWETRPGSITSFPQSKTEMKKYIHFFSYQTEGDCRVDIYAMHLLKKKEIWYPNSSCCRKRLEF